MVYDYKEKFSVQGKKCIVTGGAQGLSRGMAEGLLENGAEVVLMDLQKEKLEQAVEEYCKKGYKAHGVAGDLSKKAELDRMFDEAMELLGGKLDVMIPAAGIQRRYEPWEFPEEMWNLVINVDLNHVWFMCQRAIQVMRDKDTVGKHQHRFDEFLLWRNYRASVFCGKRSCDSAFQEYCLRLRGSQHLLQCDRPRLYGYGDVC